MVDTGVREIGIVKWYDSEEGSGYIGRKKGDDVYVHYSALRCEACSKCELNEGDAVEFALSEGSHGLQAQDVVILG
jgi:CspA family cold shock protein